MVYHITMYSGSRSGFGRSQKQTLSSFPEVYHKLENDRVLCAPHIIVCSVLVSDQLFQSLWKVWLNRKRDSYFLPFQEPCLLSFIKLLIAERLYINLLLPAWWLWVAKSDPFRTSQPAPSPAQSASNPFSSFQSCAECPPDLFSYTPCQSCHLNALWIARTPEHVDHSPSLCHMTVYYWFYLSNTSH